jgi:CDP-paratose 2-epimerase
MILVTGAGGLIGSAVSSFFLNKKLKVIGIENNKRKFFFGKSADIKDNLIELNKNKNFTLVNSDINNIKKINEIYKLRDIKLTIHAAAQPSHDWSASKPLIDYTVNAMGTINLLEVIRKYRSNSQFIFISTNKVYGDHVNKLKYYEKKERYEVEKKYKNGFDENIPIDDSLHSPFGASKLSADIMSQEYGKYFGLKTCCLRAGCLTGQNHSSVELHGFLSYLFKCAYYNKNYNIFGYKGKQVRDNLSSFDVASIIWELYKKKPEPGEVFNIGGGRDSNISIFEAINKCELITKNKFKYRYIPKARKGDHRFWISDMKKFKLKYKNWKLKLKIDDVIEEMNSYENFKSKKKLFSRI